MTTDFVIEKGVPVPEAGYRAPRSPQKRYPFKAMEVGDSFLMQTESFESWNALRVAAMAQKRNSKTFSVRRVVGGFRCWRIA